MAPTPGPIPEATTQIGTESLDHGYVSPLNSSLTVTNTKGLLNMPGQNNCFLNSAVQVLWHLDIFRRSFRELSGHACMAESCIFCALKELFTQFQYSQESALPPDALRHALARTFCDQRRFQLGFMDDAAECFENILLRIHVHIANQEHEDMCGNQHCIPHQKFAMTIVEQPICTNCGTSSEPLPFTQMVHYVTTSALCSKALELHKQGVSANNSFGTLLQLAGDVGEVRKCSSNCGSRIHMKKTLMNLPEIVSIGLVWDSECSSAKHITDVFHCIGMCLRLKDMFHAVYDFEWAESSFHELVGVVTYYGKHYSTFFFHTKLRVWIYFDDAAVREIGPSWDSVVEKCQKGRFQPLLLLFANPNGTSISPSPVTHDMSLHHGPYKSGPAKLSSIKQAIIQKYLTLQSKLPSDFARTNYKNFRERSNSYDPALQRHDTQVYTAQQSMISELSNNRRSQIIPLNSMACNPTSNVPVYSNASVLGIAIPSNNYGNPNHPKAVSLPNHIYSNIHVPNSQLQNHAESSPQIQMTGMRNDTCLPPLHNTSKYPRTNAMPYAENPEMVHYKSKDQPENAKDSDSAFTEEDPDNETYISRKTVESVLNLQRHMTLSRSYSHSSVGNRNSSSSLESFDNIHCAKLSNNNQIVQDPANFLWRRDSRDSGQWSGDRNSSSSSSTCTENPFLTVFAAKRLMLGLNHASNGKPQLPDYANPNTSDHGYDSYSVSSSDSFPSITNSPVKLDPRLTQIPEDWSTQEYCEDLDSKLKMVTDESGPPDCDKLCAEADLLLAKSHEKEKEGDLVMAALLSDSAAARARAAMDAPYNSSRSLVSAKMKHSTCVMRSSCLYRRLKDNEADERRKIKGHHSRQSSRDSTHSRHSRQGSKDSTNAKQSPKETSSQVFEDLENFGKNIEIYGTLPKKGNKKKASVATLSSKAKDDQVYKDFLDKQRKNTDVGTANEHTGKSSKLTSPSDGAKAKAGEKPTRSNSQDGLPKTPQRKKHEGTSKDDLKPSNLPKKGKMKQPIEQSYFTLFQSHDDCGHETDVNGRDLLSPLSSPDKKQHRIKRKLMGGFMKRKNRSLPDLRAEEELSDDFERSVDDASITIPSMLTLPNGTLKKIESVVDTMSRGFHQPHHAFIKKDLTQRPLLMKVNPPNVQCSTPNAPISKLTHTLPSLPHKHVEPKSPRHEIRFPSPSKIPFMASLLKSENPSHPLLHPLKCDVKTPPTHGTPKLSSIPVLSPTLRTEMVKDNSPEGNRKSSASSDDLPLPSNSFLAEIQAKRKQIIDTKDNDRFKKEIKPPKLLQPIVNKNLPSQLPKLATGSNSDGTSWLKELQTKQLQMKHKQQDSPTPITLGSTSPDTPKEKSIKNNSDTKSNMVSNTSNGTRMESNGLETNQTISAAHQFTELSVSSDECKPDRNADKKPPGSVKDLASKFEKILIQPKEPVNSEKTMTSSDHTKSQSTPKLIRQPSEINGDQVDGKSSDAGKAKNEPIHDKNQHQPHLPPPDQRTVQTNSKSPDVGKSLNEHIQMSHHPHATPPDQRTIHTNTSGNPMQRPQQPPDYETAMQRLEFIRTNPQTGSTNLQQNYSDSDKKWLSIPKPASAPVSSANSPKKKLGPKKTVTFSDEVVLVACAEFDDSGFFSNPLLERVYQKHIQSGGNEISHFSGVGSQHKSSETSEIAQEGQSRPMENTQRHIQSAGDSSEMIPCHLCHNKYISSTTTYCTDCAFYMSKFQA